MFAVWLLLQKSDMNYLGKIIDNLCMKYDSISFLPHITVYGLMNLELSEITRAVKDSIENLKPFKIKNIGIKHSEEFWKTLFIQIKSNPECSMINQKLSEKFSVNSYQFSPHISLLYKKISIQQKTEIANSLKIKNEFTVDRIAIQKFSKNINEWKIVDEFSLHV